MNGVEWIQTHWTTILEIYGVLNTLNGLFPREWRELPYWGWGFRTLNALCVLANHNSQGTLKLPIGNQKLRVGGEVPPERPLQRP